MKSYVDIPAIGTHGAVAKARYGVSFASVESNFCMCCIWYRVIGVHLPYITNLRKRIRTRAAM